MSELSRVTSFKYGGMAMIWQRSERRTVKLVVYMVDLAEQNDTEINELVHVLIIRFNTPFSGNSVQVTHWTPTQLQTPWSATTKDHFTTQTHCRLRMSN